MAEDLSINSANGAVTLKYYSTKVDTDADADSAGYLDFDGYLKLMVAQMSNQDFNDPMSDSEFIQQMASYSMMETIGKLNEQSQISYASSLVGKAVTVNDGSNVETGIVESVIIGDGKYQLLINGAKYDSDKVTDIVDAGTYNTLSKLIGMNGTVKDKELGEYTGKITNILIRSGEGFAVINNRLYPFSEINISSDSGSSSESGEASGTENAGESGENAPVTDNSSAEAETAANSGAVQSAQVSASGASMFLGEDGYDTTAIDEYAQQKLDEYYGSIQEDEETEDVEEYPDDEEEENFSDVLTDYMSPMERASAAQRSAVLGDDGFYATKVEDAASSFSGVNNHSDEEGVTVRASTAKSNSDDEDVISISEDDESVLADYGMASAVANAESGRVSSDMTSSLNPTRKASDFTEDPGVPVGITVGSNSSYDQWPPAYRAFQDQYPAEAALANEYGTKMCDIRFIHNTDITSVINTDTVLGSTVSGKYFTDLGYAGMGKLGEVVTWADGTQRVEIIGRNGSTWYTTSGRFTLDEICDFSVNFKLGGELTVFEKVIRAAAREYTPEEQAILDSYNTAWAQHAYYNSATLLAEEEKKEY